MENKKLKIGIFGLGLIGGSILKALYFTDKYYLIAVSKSSYKEAENFCDYATDNISALSDADVIFVCSKMKDTNDKLLELENVAGPQTIVADVSSIKGFLHNEYKFNFIQTHPMAGTEFSGFSASKADLFKGAKWIINRFDPVIIGIINDTGANPVVMDSVTHDRYTAQISHLPTLLSFALFNSVEDDARKIASSGFRDMTRLALSNPDLAYDMLNFNRQNIEEAFIKLINSMEEIKNLPEDEFKKLVYDIAQKRSKMYDENGKNIF